VKDRLVKLGGSKMTSDGILIIEAKRYRTQDQNKADAVQRLDTLINKASQAPILRQATRPTRASKEVRLESKKKRSEQKKLRQGGNDNHEW
jgi:ribosome-associated protein